MTREEMIQRLKTIRGTIDNMPDLVTENQRKEISWIIADITDVIWDLEEQANEG